MKVDDLRSALSRRRIFPVSTVKKAELVGLLNDYEDDRRGLVTGRFGDEDDVAVSRLRQEQVRLGLEEQARREEDRDDMSIGGDAEDMVSRFAQRFVRQYDKVMGLRLLRETLGGHSPFVAYAGGAGVGSFIQQIPFERVKAGMGIAFFARYFLGRFNVQAYI